MSRVQFNLITMKDGKINVEEKKDLSKMLTDNLEGLREKHVDEVFRQRTKKVKQKTELAEKDHIKEAYDQIKAKTKVKEEKLAPGFYLNNKNSFGKQNSEFFTSELKTMAEIITDEAKKWKIQHRMSEGKTYGTFRRYKSKQPLLVKAYKTRKGAEQNTFWRNH